MILLFKSICYIFATPKLGLLSYLNKKKEVDTLSYKTVSINKENAEKKWLLVDAEGETLGRMASKVAQLIRGKHKPNFTPHADCGDNVRSEEHTSELQSRPHLVCRLLLEKK